MGNFRCSSVLLYWLVWCTLDYNGYLAIFGYREQFRYGISILNIIMINLEHKINNLFSMKHWIMWDELKFYMHSNCLEWPWILACEVFKTIFFSLPVYWMCWYFIVVILFWKKGGKKRTSYLLLYQKEKLYTICSYSFTYLFIYLKLKSLKFFGRHSTDREVALMMLMAYLSYMMAEVRFLILSWNFCFRSSYWVLCHWPLYSNDC